ncbi:hypothetical protein M3J09_005352 [Ascochyta lentis]
MQTKAHSWCREFSNREGWCHHVQLRAKKITPRASRQHLIDLSSPPTHSNRCCSGCSRDDSLMVGNWASKLESGTPCLTRWAVHDHSLPLFAATRRSRIGQLQRPSMAQRLSSPDARTQPIMQFRNIPFIIEIIKWRY